MRLTDLSIRNFRCFDTFSLTTGGDSLYLVSENAGGKSSLLSAIARALGMERHAELADFADPDRPIEITATLTGFEPADQAAFPKELSFKGAPTLRIGFRATWSKAEGESEVTFGFPDHGWRAASREQRQALRIISLPARRDPGRLLQLAAQRGFLADLVAALKLGPALEAAALEIKKTLNALAGSPGIGSLMGDASRGLGALIPGVDAKAFSIGFETASTRDLLGEFNLLLEHGGVPIPLYRQSNGLGELSVFVFAMAALANQPKAILLVDEPEISLHPQAQRALVTALRQKGNQLFVATHSSNILDRADPRTVIRLWRRSGGVVSARAAGLRDEEAERLSRFANPQTTEACFARRVVFVEGYSDRLALLRLQTRLGRDLDAEGTTVVALDGGSGIGSHIALFGPNGLQLDVYGLCDEDKESQWSKVLQAVGISSNDRAAMRASGFFVCVKDLEQEFIRVLGIPGVSAVIAAEGETASFMKFVNQPPYASVAVEEQLRAFLHKNNTRWAAPLVDALDLKAIPGPLNDLFNSIKP